MSIIFNIIYDEKKRLENLLSIYKDKINSFPKGYIVIREKNHDKQYMYLNFRDKDKIRTRYIGPVSSEQADILFNEINERKKFENLFKTVKSDLNDVNRVLKYAKR